MTNLITEARELCENAERLVNELHTERLDYNTEYLPLIDAIQTIPELCDALEKAEEQNKQLLREVCKLACESVEREKKLAKLEAEIERMRNIIALQGEPVFNYDTVSSTIYPPPAPPEEGG